MNSRSFGKAGVAATVILAAGWLPLTAAADDGPSYSFIGASYEWTDVKYAVNPTGDPAFANGDFEGTNIDASLGILSWLHVAGQYFKGSCIGCNPNNGRDTAFRGYRVGLGYNQSLGFIGEAWSATDFVLRGNYLDVELDRVDCVFTSCGAAVDKPPQISRSVDDNGWEIQAEIRTAISPASSFHIGYEYQDVGDVKNRNLTIGLDYRLFDGLALTADGVVFDDDTGFSLGARWYFGSLLFGNRDSIVR